MDQNGMFLSWENISLSSKNKEIIHNDTGYINSNAIVAIIGPNKSGKTSFLNILAGKVTNQLIVKGCVYVNNKEREYETWKRYVAFVGDEYYAYKKQTVYETIYFSKKLGNKSYDDKALVDKILKSLDIHHIKERRLDEISIGEYKRTAIGIELISNPSFLFMDEPTNGLDSLSAVDLIKTLKVLSKHMTVIITVDQPTFIMSQLFSSLFLISEGSLLFKGNSYDCIEFFEECGYQVPKNTNPYDYFVEIVSINSKDEKTISESVERFKSIQRQWHEKQEVLPTNQKETFKELKRVHKPELSLNSLKLMLCNWFRIFAMLFYRNLIEHKRDKRMLSIQIGQKIFIAIVLSLTFLRLGLNSNSTQSRTGVISFILINSIFSTFSPIILLFPMEMKIIERERNSGFYDGFTAYIAKYLAILCYELPLGFIYGSSIYWTINLNPNAGRFIIFLLILDSGIAFAAAFGYTIGSLAPNGAIAQMFAITIFIICVLYGGSFTNSETIPSWLYWIIWISPVNYYYRAIMINQYKDFALENRSGNELLALYDLEGISEWGDIFGLWGLTLFVILVGAIGLHFKTARKS